MLAEDISKSEGKYNTRTLWKCCETRKTAHVRRGINSDVGDSDKAQEVN